MSVWIVVVLVLIGVLVPLSFIAGIVLVILAIVRSVRGTVGGWRALTAVYSTNRPPSGQVMRRETLQIGAVFYRYCVTLGVADEGLYVSILRTTILIPWHEFNGLQPGTLDWKKAQQLKIGDLPVATIKVPQRVFELFRLRLPGDLANTR